MCRLAGAALAASATAAIADTPRDGSWAIEIVTERGTCDRLYRYYVVIEDGAVRLRSPFGEIGPEPIGILRQGGRVDAIFGEREDPVKVRGRLRASSGDGRWSASARGCTGRWSAFKRT